MKELLDGRGERQSFELLNDLIAKLAARGYPLRFETGTEVTTEAFTEMATTAEPAVRRSSISSAADIFMPEAG